MTAVAARAQKRRSRPVVGGTIPVSVVRLGMAVLMLALSYAVIGFTLYLPVAILLVVAAIAFPKTPAAWGLAILVALLALAAYNEAPYWQFFVALAGVHALHQFGMTLVWLPANGRIQVPILLRMLRSYLIIQIPAQLVSYAVLSLLSGASVGQLLITPAFGVVAAACLLLLVIVVVLPILRRTPDE